ncbi:hypothetical protein MSG28_006734 [Choristoneura fumiferana]|uniref:Uncharacterized protein n=1 Tax=Choristoneura fumiferana TaxID=7141 RepID=A0ACC0JL25_CHOFU|nr:hypothetical protein MSG28_006734 [Choristoneura fumiferana]
MCVFTEFRVYVAALKRLGFTSLCTAARVPARADTILCTVAFDSPESALKMDTLTMLTSGIKEKSFFLHYEFPSYATGEVGARALRAREAGHGALASAACCPSCAAALRRSSSMASVCGGSLALLDAGVPLCEPGGRRGRWAGDAAGRHSHAADYRILTIC